MFIFCYELCECKCVCPESERSPRLQLSHTGFLKIHTLGTALPDESVFELVCQASAYCGHCGRLGFVQPLQNVAVALHQCLTLFLSCIPNSALAIQSSALAVLAVRQQNIHCSPAPPTSHSGRESGQTTLP